MPEYLLKNGHGIYHFRLKVPKQLRHIVGQREIKRSLRTRDPVHAKRLAQIRAAQFLTQFEELSMRNYEDPLMKQLKFKSITVEPNGTKKLEGVELDPDNIEADTKALNEIINGTTQPSSIMLKKLIDEYLEAMKENCNTKSLAGYTAQLETFLEILGDVPIQTVTRKRARESVKILKQLPPNRNKLKQFRGLSIAAIIQLKPEKVMSVTTVRLHIERMTALFDFAIREQYTDYNPYQGLKPKKKTRPDQERKELTAEDVLRLTDPEKMKDVSRFPSRYWIPMIAAYTGMRLEEICQLRTEDIQHLDGIPCVSINDDGDKRLKNLSAHRVVPIHSKLIELGFIDFASKQQGELFPELREANGKRGHHFSKWFARHRKQCGVVESGKTFHSFRHTVASQFKREGINETIAAAILGHSVQGETYGRYGKEYRPKQLREVIEVIKYT